MSRSLSRGLLAAPLLVTALMLSACGGGDDAADQATASSPAGANASAELVTSPSTPTDPTTPATSPTADSGDAAKDDKTSAGKNDRETPAPAPAATETSAPAATDQAESTPKAAAATPEKLRPSTEKAQNDVLLALAAIETCKTTTSDYAKCKEAKVINGFGATAVDSSHPGPTEVAVTNATKSTFKIIGTDKAGTRWVLTRFRSGQVTRKCKLKSGKTCSPAEW